MKITGLSHLFKWENLHNWWLTILFCPTVYIYIYIYIYISGGPLSALTCCVNVRLLSALKKISPLIYSQNWVGSWVYTTQAMMTLCALRITKRCAFKQTGCALGLM